MGSAVVHTEMRRDARARCSKDGNSPWGPTHGGVSVHPGWPHFISGCSPGKAVSRRCRAQMKFWILSLALFLKYYAVDRIHPNQDRYWKRIYKETENSLVWWKPLRWLDSGLTRIPLVRRLAGTW